MAQIIVNAVLDRTQFNQQAQALQTYINSFSTSNPIRIQIDTSALTGATTRANNFSQSMNAAFSSAQQGANNATTAVRQFGQELQNTAQQAQNLGNQANNAWGQWGQGAGNAGRYTRDVADATDLLGRRLMSLATASAWRAITSQIRESLSAMKEVDRELVTIRKVTGFGQEKISAIGQSAYSVSSQYGVLPQDYLESVANFARAGYKDASATLGELAVKTQLVGDVSASTANAMLLAVDAAYKYEGSAEKLSAVLDGMNEIDNNFATSIEKISTGIGKVTSISAQAGVGIDELSAAIGTITAVTQRSGSEAATALRALFLNIMGDTKTEIEDGAKWTAGEIEGLRDVLKTYAKDVVEAADAEKKLINPMEAVGALSKAMKDGLLTEQQLMQMVTDIGGKLRSSQLLALIQNWDMYSAQLDAFRNSAGSAGEEVSRMLDSWEVKANQLNASWTKLTSDVADTSAIKGVLDVVRGIVDLLDIGGGIPARILAIASAISAVSMAFNSIRASSTISSFLSMMASPYTIAITAAVTGAVALINHLNEVYKSQQELNEEAKENAEQYEKQKSSLDSINEQLADNKELMDDIVGKGSEATEAEQARLGVLQRETAELELQAKIQGYLAEKSGREAAESAVAAMQGRSVYTGAEVDLSGWENDEAIRPQSHWGQNIDTTIAYYKLLTRRLGDVNKEIENSPNDSDNIEKLNNTKEWLEVALDTVNGEIMKYLSDNAENAKTLDKYLDDFVRTVPENERKPWQRALLEFYEDSVENAQKIYDVMGIKTGAVASGTTTGGGSTGEVPSISAWDLQTEQHAAQVAALNKAIAEFNEHKEITKSTYDELAEAGFNLSDSLIETDDGYKIAASDLQKCIDATKEWYTKYGVKMPDTLSEIADETGKASTSFSDLANNALTLQDNAYGAAKAIKDLQDTLKATGEKGDAFKAMQQEYANVMKLINEGRWNSNEVRGFIDTFFSEEDIRAAGGYQSMTEWLGKDYFKSFFTDDALTTLKKWAKTLGEVRDENDELVASFTQNEDGTFDVFVKDLDELGKQLHIAPDALAAFFDELSNFGELGDIGGVEKLVEGMTEGVKTLEDGTKKVSFDSFVEQLTKAGVAAERIRELTNAARDSDKIVFDVDYSQISEADLLIQQTTQDKGQLDASADKPTEVKINTKDNTEPGITSAKNRINISLPKSATVTLDAEDDTDNGVDCAQSNIDSLKQTEEPKLAAEDDTDNGVDCAQANIDSLEQTKVPPLKANDEITPVAKDVQEKIDALKGKTIDLKVNYKAAFEGIKDQPTAPKGFGLIGLNGLFGGDSEASGTDFAVGGPTLVNEKGPELIADKGRAFVANGGRPTIVNLSRGAIVYNADETRELLVGGGISSYGIYSRSDGEKERERADAVFTILGINDKKDDDKDGGGGGNGKKTKPKKSDDEWWKIMQEQYEYALAKAKDQIAQIDLKITHIKNEIADAKRPLEEQIKEYEKANKQIERQITLLNRAKERMTKPIQDEIDALKAQKEIQDEQLALEEKQKAVEEARAALQNAQQERTIRYYNQETGHWEWMADQKAIADAQKNVDSAEKALADQEFNMQISELERQKDAIEKEFNDQITQLEEQKTINEDAIYALNEAIDAIDEAYAPELNTLEREKELMDRELADTEAEWAHLQFQREKKPKGNLNKAANKLGKKGATAKEIIESMTASIKDIETLAASGEINAIADSLMYGSPAMYTTMAATGISRSGSMDSHDIIINGIALTNQSAYDSFTEGLAALGIYAGE